MHFRAARQQLRVVVAIAREPRPVREQQRRLQARARYLAARRTARRRAPARAEPTRAPHGLIKLRRFNWLMRWLLILRSRALSIDSSSTPRVSGKTASTTKNCTTMHAAKNANGSDCVYAAIIGNNCAISAFIPQCVALPSACPRDRTAVGKISARYTQITAPCENAKNAMNTISMSSSRPLPSPVAKISATAASAQRRADRARQQQLLAADAIDDAQRDHRGDEIRRADGHRLQRIRPAAESGIREDVVEVVEDGVDAGELVEHREQDREHDRPPVCRDEQALGGIAPGGLRGSREFGQHCIGIRDADALVTRLSLPPCVHAGPASADSAGWCTSARRTARRAPRQCLTSAATGRRHRSSCTTKIADIRQQDAEHDVELKKAGECAAAIRGCDLRDVDRREHR